MFVSVVREDGAVFVGRRHGTFLREGLCSLLAGVPRERSGIAHAAGYAGLLSLFRHSFNYLAVSGWWPAWTLGTALTLLFGLLAPLALALSLAAAVSLERAPWKSGKLPLLVGFFLGWLGSFDTLRLLLEIRDRLAPLF
jgi:hypothetical protein